MPRNNHPEDNSQTVQMQHLYDQIERLERAVSNPVALPWKSFTPTLGGFTLGNGTFDADYVQVGKTVHFRIIFTFGSSTTAATAFPTFTLPVTALAATNIALLAQFIDVSVPAYYTALARQSSTTVVTMGIIGASGIHTTCTTTTPFTWAVGDQIILTGSYEAA